jgi:hypothetical protein
MSTVDSWTGSPFHTAVPLGGHEPHLHAPAVPSVDPDLVQQTRAEIRHLAREIAELCQSDLPLDEFYEAFLIRVVSALAAVGGAVWSQDADGRLRLRYQVNVSQAGLTAEDAGISCHARLLERTVAARQPALVPPESSLANSDEAGNPTPWLLLLGVLTIDDNARAVVEIFQRPSGGPVTQRGYLRFLSQMCDLADDFLKNRRLRHLKHEQRRWQETEDFIHAIHRDLDLTATAYAIANEGRRLIGADRVSVAVRRGRGCEIAAISGLDTFDRRSPQVDRLAGLSTVAVEMGEPLWFPSRESELPPQVTQCLQEYLDVSPARSVGVVLLRPPRAGSEAATEPDPAPLGALIIEQFGDSRVPENLSRGAGTWVAGAESSKPQGSGARVGDPTGASKTQPQPP